LIYIDGPKLRIAGMLEYLNPIGGRDLFSNSVFLKHGVELWFAESTTFEYDTSAYQYEANLSMIDVLMWNAKEEIATTAENQG